MLTLPLTYDLACVVCMLLIPSWLCGICGLGQGGKNGIFSGGGWGQGGFGLAFTASSSLICVGTECA
jgi:hypothetical protein